MKKIVLVVVAFLFGFVSMSSAADTVWNQSAKKDCYRWVISYDGNPEGAIIVNTAEDLTLKKDGMAKTNKPGYNERNDAGNSVYYSLMSISDVSQVLIFTRKIVIFKHPFPKRSWEEKKDLQKDILKALDQNLCQEKMK
jgi:hypothetical protein